MHIHDSILDQFDTVRTWRRDIHAHPETAFEEHRTAEFVARKLAEFGMEVHTGIGGTGVVGILRSGSSEKSIALRADMDALFIEEENTFAHRSTVPGKMHACGHDGHTASLLGAAQALAATPDFDGTVYFIFQPAEETGDEHCGGNAMVKDGLFERFPADMVFAMHNAPGLPVGQVGMRPGPMLASIDTFQVKVLSDNTHAATQFATTDPILVAAQIIEAFHVFKARYINPANPVILTITQLQAGDPINDRQGVHVGPAEALFRGTVYTLDNAIRDEVEVGLGRTLEGIATSHNADVIFEYERGYPVLQNDPEAVKIAAAAAATVLGEENVFADMMPLMGAEDFSFMVQEKPGCYLMFGADGNEDEGFVPCSVHNPRYDFNDDLLPIVMQFWCSLVKQTMPV